MSILEEIVTPFLKHLTDNYTSIIHKEYDLNKEIKQKLPAFLLNPDELAIYLGKDHLAIEYIGPYKKKVVHNWKTKVSIFDYSNEENFIEKIIGLPLIGTGITAPIFDESDDLFLATTSATEILTENNWNFLAQEMLFMLNMNGVQLLGKGPMRIRNSFFYDKNGNGLRVRNIQWMDIFPIHRTDIDSETEQITVSFWANLHAMALRDSHYTIPEKFDFQHDKLSILNRFIELYNSEGASETDITSFLSQPEHHFILNGAFFGKTIHPEKECIWITHPDKKPIRPDFFVTTSDGYANIVEFKLPNFKTNSVIVGKDNRETFSAELHSYIAQTRVYGDYFNETLNRKYVQEKHNIKVYKPKRYLVVGRRRMLPLETWKEIEADYSQITILTYDDIVDTVMGFLMS